MVKGCQITLSGTTKHNLLKVIKQTLSITDPPTLGAELWPEPICSLTLLMPLSQGAADAGNNVTILDTDGNEMSNIISGIPFTISDQVNSIWQQNIQLEGSVGGIVVDVSIVAR